MVTHVPIIFRNGHARVNRGFPGRHRHVRGVGNEYCPLHEGPSAAGIAQLPELVQHLGHFIAPLAAAQIDDNIGVRPFCQLVLNNGFAGAERAGNCGAAALAYWEKRVDHALPGNQRPVYGAAALIRARRADGPALGKADRRFFPLLANYPGDGLVNRVLAGRLCRLNPSGHAGRHHGPVFCHFAFPAPGKDLPGENRVTVFNIDGNFPKPFSIQGLKVDALCNPRAGHPLDRAQGSAYPVKNAADQAGPQLKGHGRIGGINRLARAQPARIFVYLNDAVLSRGGNHLAEKLLLSDKYEPHARQGPAAADFDNRTVYALDKVFFHRLILHAESCYLGKPPREIGKP